MLRKVLYTVCGVSVVAVVLALLYGTGLLPGGLIGYAWLISLFLLISGNHYLKIWLSFVMYDIIKQKVNKWQDGTAGFESTLP